MVRYLSNGGFPFVAGDLQQPSISRDGSEALTERSTFSHAPTLCTVMHIQGCPAHFFWSSLSPFLSPLLDQVFQAHSAGKPTPLSCVGDQRAPNDSSTLLTKMISEQMVHIRTAPTLGSVGQLVAGKHIHSFFDCWARSLIRIVYLNNAANYFSYADSEYISLWEVQLFQSST